MRRALVAVRPARPAAGGLEPGCFPPCDAPGVPYKPAVAEAPLASLRGTMLRIEIEPASPNARWRGLVCAALPNDEVPFFRTRRLLMRRLLLILAIALAALAGMFRYSKARTHQLFGVIVPRVETERRVVALTFDDGPTSYAADEILAALGPTRATFFVTGFGMTDSPDVVPRLIAQGHEIGNHTFHHDRLILKSPSYIAGEIESTDALIRRAGWKGPILFRAPFGKKLVGLPWYLSRHGRTHITWDVEVESDPRIDKHTDRIVAEVLARTRPGSIILLHPWYRGREATRAAIAPIIAGLRARGYDFVTVSELLEQGGLGVAGSRGLGVRDHSETPQPRDSATPR